MPPTPAAARRGSSFESDSTLGFATAIGCPTVSIPSATVLMPTARARLITASTIAVSSEFLPARRRTMCPPSARPPCHVWVGEILVGGAEVFSLVSVSERAVCGPAQEGWIASLAVSPRRPGCRLIGSPGLCARLAANLPFSRAIVIILTTSQRDNRPAERWSQHRRLIRGKRGLWRTGTVAIARMN